MADTSGKKNRPLPVVLPPLPLPRLLSTAEIATLQARSNKASERLRTALAVKTKNDDDVLAASLTEMKDAIDQLVPHYLLKTWNSTAVAIGLKTGYSDSTLRRNATNVAILRTRMAAGNQVPPSEMDRAYGGVQGRRPRLSPEVAIQLQQHINDSAAAGNAVKKVSSTRSVHLSSKFAPIVKNSHREVVEMLIGKQWRVMNPGGSAPPPSISDSSLRRAVAHTSKPKAVAADYSTKRRLEARSDLGNAISLAAAWAFLQRWAPGLGVAPDEIMPELCTNLDFSSVFLNEDDKIEVLIGETTAEEMKKLHASVKTSKVGERADGGYGNGNRSYGYATLTTMGGTLGMFVQLVKDTCYKGKKVVAVSVRFIS